MMNLRTASSAACVPSRTKALVASRPSFSRRSLSSSVSTCMKSIHPDSSSSTCAGAEPQGSTGAGKTFDFDLEAESTVLVFGGTGGVGQLLVYKLLQKGFKVRAVIRNEHKALRLLGPEREGLSYVRANTADPSTLEGVITPDVDAVVIATGTSAFQSSKWEGGHNTPFHVDYLGVLNVIDAARKAHRTQKRLRRLVLISSAGTQRYALDAQHPFVAFLRAKMAPAAPSLAAASVAPAGPRTADIGLGITSGGSLGALHAEAAAGTRIEGSGVGLESGAPVFRTPARARTPATLPYALMNIPADVLECKKRAEDHLRSSGLPFTIIRPGRLTGGPLSFHELGDPQVAKRQAKLLAKRAFQLSRRDDLDGFVCRAAVAEAIAQALLLEHTEGHAFAIETVSTARNGPGDSTEHWDKLFASA